MQSERSDWVDYAKALGILLVVYGHVVRGLVSAGLLPTDSKFRLVDSVIYSFHMPLFFFLSGIFFLNSLSRRSIFSFIANKIDSVAYPYVLWSLLQGLIEVNLSKQKTTPVTYAQVAGLFYSPRAQFWFLYILFAILIISAVIYQRKRKSDSIFIMMTAIILYLQPFRNQYPPLLSLIANNMVFFSFGAFLGSYGKIQKLGTPFYFPIYFFAAILFQYIFHSSLGLNYQDIGFLSLVVAVMSILAVVALTMQIEGPRYSLLQWIGRHSMTIFLMHILAAAGIRILLLKGLGISNVGIHIGLGVFAGVFLPLWFIKALGDRGKNLLAPPMEISAQRMYLEFRQKKWFPK